MKFTKPWFWTEDDDATLTEQWAAGALHREIAAEIGCTVEQLMYRARVLNLGKRVRSYSDRIGVPVPQAEPDPWAGTRAADKAFALAMKGRSFASIKVSGDPRRLYTASRDAGRGGSSIEMPA